MRLIQFAQAIGVTQRIGLDPLRPVAVRDYERFTDAIGSKRGDDIQIEVVFDKVHLDRPALASPHDLPCIIKSFSQAPEGRKQILQHDLGLLIQIGGGNEQENVDVLDLLIATWRAYEPASRE